MYPQQTKTEQALAFFARKIIAKYNPFIIGITGSVGKTSARHAIACVLREGHLVREPIKNYNNQIGIPLTIIGAKGVENSWPILGFLRVFVQALCVWLLPLPYPKILVLEYGIDKPNDMDQLLAIAKPEVAVITTIGISHREFFKDESEIAFEKGKLAAALNSSGIFVFNHDDPNVAKQTDRTKAKPVSYGLKPGADVQLLQVTEQLGLRPKSTLQVAFKDLKLDIDLPAVGTAHVAAALAAVAVGYALKIPNHEIASGLSNYRVIPGRLNVIAGIKKTIIIDDSYNAAPVSMKEALLLLSRFPVKHKVAVLGDMLELGPESMDSHKGIGELVAKLNIDQLYTVGELGKVIAESAKKNGFSETKIKVFENSELAGQYLRENLVTESVVLVKGSQGVRMEKISKEILAEPGAASKLLPRQDGKWVS